MYIATPYKEPYVLGVAERVWQVIGLYDETKF